MTAFGQVAKGTRARKTVRLPIGGAKAVPETGGWDGDTVPVDIRVLTPAEEIQVLADAIAYARKKGLSDPAEGMPIYDVALQVHTLAVACLDADSPSPLPFFDGGVEQILTSEDLSREHIAYLYEQQLLWQDACSPRASKMSQAEFMAAVVRTAGGNLHDFLAMSPAMRWSFMRSLAILHVNSLAARSSSSTNSPIPPPPPVSAN